MSRIASLFLTACFLIWPAAVAPYELSTHALLTFSAYIRARLGTDPALLANLGLLDSPLLLPSDQRPLGIFALDVKGDQVRVRLPDSYEFLAMSHIEASFGVGNGDLQTARDRGKVPGWLMTGAIREDDNPAESPFDDPYVTNHAFHREFNHFFDPAKNRPLIILGQALGDYYALYTDGERTIRRAPDWGTGSNDAFGAQSGRGADTLNHFTTLDAREAMWRALTLTRIDAGGMLSNLSPDSIPGNSSAEVLRKAYWATTFRALGDVLHLNQDMAQPQHTRNEAHSGVGLGFIQGTITGHESAVEKYIDARARRLKSFDVAGSEVAPLQPLTFAAYPIPRFSRYSDYWSTGTPAGAPVGQLQPGYIDGKGLAEYTNRGFFTFVRNFGTQEYLYPSSNPGDYSVELTTLSYPNTQGTIKKEYLRGVVTDKLENATAVIRMTARGVFDDVVTEFGVVNVSAYTLDANVLDDQASLLIPRAIAYSAGLLDYFFRGEITFSLPDDGVYAVIDHTQNQCPNTCGFSTIKLKMQNTSPNAESMSGGVFVAVIKYHRNLCYRADLSGDPGGPQFISSTCRSTEEEITMSDKLSISALASGGMQSAKFTFARPIPINATDIYLQVVFRGQLGNEIDAVVVTTKNISEPNYISVSNNYDYKYDAATDTFQAVTPTPPFQFITGIDVKMGNSPTPIATLAQLGPRQNAQLAFLTDLGTSGTENVVIDFSAGIPSPLTYASFPIATFDSPGGTVYQRSKNVSLYRGVWRDFHMPFFQQSQAYTLYLCVPTDTRRICTSAGLPPTTSADVVPWTINF